MLTWVHHMWFAWFWPSIKGNGPEALVQTVVYGLIAAIFVPVVRRFVLREFTKAHAVEKELHQKLDHIIHHHPDIPDFPGDTAKAEDSGTK